MYDIDRILLQRELRKCRIYNIKTVQDIKLDVSILELCITCSLINQEFQSFFKLGTESDRILWIFEANYVIIHIFMCCSC